MLVTCAAAFLISLASIFLNLYYLFIYARMSFMTYDFIHLHISKQTATFRISINYNNQYIKGIIVIDG